jgi:ADP-ribosylglycohydrolase
MFIGDAHGVPLHWYYNRDVLLEHRQKFYNDKNGRQTEIHAIHPEAKQKHPDSTKPLSFILGDAKDRKVVFQDTKLYEEPNTHYHATLQKGENTIPANVASLLIKSLAEHGGYDQEAFVKSYVNFFTTPNAHNDVFIGGLHRTFVKNVLAGKPLEECPMSGVFAGGGDCAVAIPLMLFYYNNLDLAKKMLEKRTYLTYKSENALRQNVAYGELFHAILNGTCDPQVALQKAFKEISPEDDADLSKLVAEEGDTDELYRTHFQVS